MGDEKLGFLRQSYASIIQNGFSILNCNDVSAELRTYSYEVLKVFQDLCTVFKDLCVQNSYGLQQVMIRLFSYL